LDLEEAFQNVLSGETRSADRQVLQILRLGGDPVGFSSFVYIVWRDREVFDDLPFKGRSSARIRVLFAQMAAGGSCCTSMGNCSEVSLSRPIPNKKGFQQLMIASN